jgi:hypothetical protein
MPHADHKGKVAARVGAATGGIASLPVVADLKSLWVVNFIEIRSRVRTQAGWTQRGNEWHAAIASRHEPEKMGRRF